MNIFSQAVRARGAKRRVKGKYRRNGERWVSVQYLEKRCLTMLIENHEIKNVLTFLRSSGRIEHGRGSSLCCLVLAKGCGVLCSPGASKIMACELFTNKSFYSHWKERSLVM